MGKLKTFTKIGAENKKGKVIIPAVYGDIDRVDKYLGFDENNKIINVFEPIYLAYSQPYYELYTANGKIECPFNIKYYCVKNGILIGLLDSDGYWHIIGIDSSTATVKTIYENLDNIESANHNHVVCRQTNGNQFVYSLEKKDIIVPPSFYNRITLHSEGIIAKKEEVCEVYNYSGHTILSDKWYLSVVPGVKINSHELILARTKNNLAGLYSFTGKCILPCHHYNMKFYKHYCNQKEYITVSAFDTSEINNHVLFLIDNELQTQIIYTDYSSIDFFDCGRVALMQTPTGYTLSLMQFFQTEAYGIDLISADKIEPLCEHSCKHFIVWNKNKCGLCNLQGKIIVPIVYKKITTNTWKDKIYAKSFWGFVSTFNL